MVTIRRMRNEDVEEVGKMYSDFYSYHRRIMGSDVTYSPEWGIEELRAVGGTVLVALDGSEIVGFARVKEDEGAYFLKEIYVKPEHRGRGVGKSLLKACEEEAGGNLYASVIPANLTALDFFLREGYSFLNSLELTRADGDVETVVLGRVVEAITPAGFNLGRLSYEVLEGKYCISVCDEVPSNFLAVVRDSGELTVISRTRCGEKAECGYRIIRFPNLSLELVGLMATISSSLASEGISILAISSYSSDFILVKGKDLERALNSLGRISALRRRD